MKKFLPLLLVLGIILSWTIGLRADTKPSLAILPFFVEKGKDPERGAICPICKSIYQRGSILPGSKNTLTRLLYQKMEAIGAFKVFPIEKAEEGFSHFQSYLQLGKELNADFIIIGFVFRFEERVGSPIGVEKPASVAFDLHLFRVKDGKRVWDGRFNETQRPLSENVLKIGSFLRRKASWLTAEELASVGMDEILKQLPEVKKLEE